MSSLVEAQLPGPVLATLRELVVERGQEVSLPGFGRFALRAVKERTGRSPQTGGALTIPARSRVQFKPARGLKDALGGAPIAVAPARRERLVLELAAQLVLTPDDTALLLGRLLAAIARQLADQHAGPVELRGLGQLERIERDVREGRNPSTGEPITIAASSSVRFNPSAALKQALTEQG